MNNQNKTEFDVIIVGGGLVGASLACALASAQPDVELKIAVIENYIFDHKHQPSFDSRTVALSYSSKAIFETLGLWSRIEKLGACAINEIHISDRGHMGLTHLRASEQDSEALGYVIENQILGKALYQRLSEYKNVHLFCPATVTSFKTDKQSAEVKLTEGDKQTLITARLLVAADGGQSFVRQQAEIKTRNLEYNQTAIITNVACDIPHKNIAYERFTDTGPLALLPLNDCDGVSNRYSLVWTLKNSQVEKYLSLDDESFLAALQQRFGIRAGRFIKTAKRISYPLALMRVRESVQQRLAIIGNAAHTLHPVAGQGFNLGLRDVASLAEIIVQAELQLEDFGDLHCLQKYEAWRKRDLLQTTLSTDGLVRLFTTKFLPVVVARNMALLAMDMLPGLKKNMGRQAMGFVGKVNRLARGLPLS